jgi:hypothetical protein
MRRSPKRRRVVRIPAEPGWAEVSLSPPAVREGPIVMLGVKRPHVEVLDPGCPVQIVASGPLAQRPAQQPARIPSRAVRVPHEKPGLCLCRECLKMDQVGLPDAFQRPLTSRSHAPRMPRPYRSSRNGPAGHLTCQTRHWCFVTDGDSSAIVRHAISVMALPHVIGLVVGSAPELVFCAPGQRAVRRSCARRLGAVRASAVPRSPEPSPVREWPPATRNSCGGGVAGPGGPSLANR